MSLLKLHGEIISIGDMPADEVPQIAGVPHVLIRLDGQGGRTVLISGLTRDECRACAEAFMEQVVVDLGLS